jgi:hypothetical protein
MKKILFAITVALTLLSGAKLFSQDVQANLDAARSSYQSGDLESTRFALQEALNMVNQAIGQEILGLLPASFGGMEKTPDGDNVTGTNMGFAGLFVSRSYGSGNKNASVEIVGDSPLMRGINALLTMPSFMSSDPNQKRIKIGSYKALQTKSTDEQGVVSWDIQLPLTNTLLTIKCTGVQNESEVTGMANTLPIDKIAKLAE